MGRMGRGVVLAALISVGCALAVPAASLGSGLLLKQIATTAATGGVLGAAEVRTSDGVLHLVYGTKSAWGGGFDGVGSLSISPAGTVVTTAEALTGWNVGTPGLFETAGGSLEAVFGGGPDTGGTGYSGPWGITSTDGGGSWSAPAEPSAAIPTKRSAAT